MGTWWWNLSKDRCRYILGMSTGCLKPPLIGATSRPLSARHLSGADVPENRTKVFPMQEFQQHHSNNQMQGQRGCTQIFLSALKKWWAMMLCSMLEGTNRRSAARLHPGQLDRRRHFRLNHSSGFQFCTKDQSFTPKKPYEALGSCVKICLVI